MADIVPFRGAGGGGRVPPSDGDDGFSATYDAMADEIDSLRCVCSVLSSRISSSTVLLNDNEMLAALGLLTRATERIDKLHTEFEEQHLRRLKAGARP
ncbi:MAG: hypothetical protein KGJ68_06270 [Gammaproteobacteria bacterium]|nr:hypothetical protein [Gammaproteobacteria bacterium]